MNLKQAAHKTLERKKNFNALDESIHRKAHQVFEERSGSPEDSKKPKYLEQTKFKTQHTRAVRLVARRLVRRSATTRTISAVASTPVLATSAPMSLRKDSS